MWNKDLTNGLPSNEIRDTTSTGDVAATLARGIVSRAGRAYRHHGQGEDDQEGTLLNRDQSFIGDEQMYQTLPPTRYQLTFLFAYPCVLTRSAGRPPDPYGAFSPDLLPCEGHV